MSDEQRTKRSAKKPAWMNDEMLIDPADVEPEVKVPKPHPKKAQAVHDMAQRVVPAHQEVVMQRPIRPTGRMCSNPQCKNPFDSPQWRRGPLGPGTLCNACGTRYARLQAKMNGDKKGKMRPSERAEWEAFEQQRLNPQVPQQQQTWRMHVQHFVQREQQQQYYQDDEYAGYEDSDYGYDERSYGSQQGAGREQQYYDDDDMGEADPEGGQMAGHGGLSDSPGMDSRAVIAAVTAAAAAAAGGQRGNRPVWRGSRQHIPAADATDSQEDEAGAYSCQDAPAGLEAAANGSPAGPSFLHLLAVGEAMIKTEGVAPQERRAAYTEVVGKGMGPEPDRAPARAAGGEAAQGVKRSRFALEAEEQHGGRPASAAEPTAPTALQRALERCAGQAGSQRTKAAAGEHPVAADRFERLLAEAEACVRARSVSPCMQKGMPGAGASPTCNMPALRPITPLQLGVNAVDAAGKSGLPRSLLGVELGQHNGQHGLGNFVLPAAAVSRRPVSATASGRHASLAQALAAAAAAAEVDSADDDGAGMGLQGSLHGSPNSQYDVSASNAGSVANRGDAAKAFDAAVDAYFGDGAAGRNLPQEGGAKHPHFEGQHGPAAGGDLRSHMQVLLANLNQLPSSAEPSPVSKMLLADEVLSPTPGLKPSGRPLKQARTHGPDAGGGDAAAAGHQLPGAPGDMAGLEGAAASGAMQSAHMSLQQQMLLQSLMMQHNQGQQPHGMVGSAQRSVLPGAAELQQAGQRPVVLACQLVLQQQANPTALRPLFETPTSCPHPVHSQPQDLPGPAASAELVTNALQLAHAGSGGNTQTHLDQLKAVTLSAQAAAATASAVAAATALLWQQLQQQEQARREQQLHQQPSGGHEAPLQAEQEAVAGADVVADGEPAPPGSPAAAAVEDPAAAQGVSGSLSRSSSSSTSAAGLSTAPGQSQHSVDKTAAPCAVQEQQSISHGAVPTPNVVAVVADAGAAASMPLPADGGVVAEAGFGLEPAGNPSPAGAAFVGLEGYFVAQPADQQPQAMHDVQDAGAFAGPLL